MNILQSLPILSKGLAQLRSQAASLFKKSNGLLMHGLPVLRVFKQFLLGVTMIPHSIYRRLESTHFDPIPLFVD